LPEPMRTWGLGVDAEGLTEDVRRGVCKAGETCQIYDWRFGKDYDGNLKARTLPASGDCALGLVSTFGVSNPTASFLEFAYEVPFDGRGNDNGICETGETCVLAPHIGAYQGHGGLKDGCKHPTTDSTIK